MEPKEKNKIQREKNVTTSEFIGSMILTNLQIYMYIDTASAVRLIQTAKQTYGGHIISQHSE